MAALEAHFVATLTDGTEHIAKPTQQDYMQWELCEYYGEHRPLVQSRFVVHNFLLRTGVLKTTWKKFNEVVETVRFVTVKGDDEVDPTDLDQPTTA